jgi:hypothetical protein
MMPEQPQAHGNPCDLRGHAVSALAVMVALLLLVGQAWCEEVTTYVLSKGNSSCSEFLQAMDAERKGRPAHPAPIPPGYWAYYSEAFLAFAMFADGFLTGVNFASDEARMAGASTDLWGRMLWIENYCHRQPLKTYINALLALKRHLQSR